MPPKSQPNSNDYSDANIPHFEPREHMRLRPGMYIGGTNERALHQLVWEVLDDAISEFENTVYNEITISLLTDRTICIADDGEGIPVEPYDKHGVSWLEAYFTQIGRWDVKRKAPEDTHRPHSSLFGVGVPAVNALSSFCEVEVKRDGYSWTQTYSEGKPNSAIEQLFPLGEDEGTGTRITFRPDFTIMEENDFDFYLIAERCRELAYLLPHLRFIVQDLRGSRLEIAYHYPQGLNAWLKNVAETDAVMIAPLTISYDCKLQDKQDKSYLVKVQLGFQWFWDDKYRLSSYVNTIPTTEGGKHVNSLKAELERQVGLSWNRLEDGFIGIIHVLHPDPQFESQTRIRLLNHDISTAVEEAIQALFAAHPEAKASIQSHFNRS